MSSQHHGKSRWGTAGREMRLQCAKGCGFRTTRLVSDDGYGHCPTCQGSLKPWQGPMAAKRLAKAKAELKEMGQ